MSFSKYPAYKDSGVEWIGDIPVGWNLLNGRRLFADKRISAQSGDEQLSATQKYGVIPQKDFMKNEDQKVTLAISGIDNFRHVDEGDFVISLRSFQGGIEYSYQKGCVSPAYTVLCKKNKINDIFWSYLFKSRLFIDEINASSEGIRDGKTIRYEQFGKISFAIPPLPEQQAIASFLDRECGKIDALITEQERLIALLAEKRQGVISHAVTKGLNPNAPMKDSGIPWIGMVPEGWEVVRLSLLSDHISSGTTPDTDNESFYDGDICWVTTGELREAAIKNTTKKVTNLAFEKFSALQIYPPGTLLLAMYGATVGRVAWLETHAATNQACCALVFSKKIKMKFAFYTLLAAKKSLLLLSSGGGQPNINQEKVRSFRIPVPSLPEQNAIIDFLDSNMRELDSLVNNIEKALLVLKERRAALISAAVTGKIDVRAQSKARAA